MVRYTGITLALIACELVDMPEPVRLTALRSWTRRFVRAGTILPQSHHCSDMISLARYSHKLGILPQTMIFGNLHNASALQFKVSTLRFVLVSCSLILSSPKVFVPWIIMARFSAKTSSMDTFPRRSTRQRRRGPSRSSSSSSHHRNFGKTRPARMATPQRSRLTFIYVGNVRAHPAADCFMCRLNFPNSLVLMSKMRTSKSCSY